MFQGFYGWGYDFRENLDVAWADYGKYATDLFTGRAQEIIANHDDEQPLFMFLAHLAVHSSNGYSPLQAPAEIVEKFKHIPNKGRRHFLAMLYKLDESVGLVVAALAKKNMLQDSIILFTTDNGGPAGGFDLNHASNWPLRGVKATLWEGGHRGSAFIWSPKLKRSSEVMKDYLVSIQDWFPTLRSAAG